MPVIDYYVMELTTLNEVSKVINGSKILIMGLTFKENVSDTRETPVVEIIKILKEFKCEIYGYDPFLNKDEISSFGVIALDNLDNIKFDCVIITVVHDVFKKIELDDLKAIMGDKPIIIDVRGMFRKVVEKNKIIYRTL